MNRYVVIAAAVLGGGLVAGCTTTGNTYGLVNFSNRSSEAISSGGEAVSRNGIDGGGKVDVPVGMAAREGSPTSIAPTLISGTERKSTGNRINLIGLDNRSSRAVSSSGSATSDNKVAGGGLFTISK